MSKTIYILSKKIEIAFKKLLTKFATLKNFLRPVYNMLYNKGPQVQIDLSLVELIRKEDVQSLADGKFCEKELLPNLGLNDEFKYEFPEYLHPFCGKGMLSWQYPIQFSQYLAQIAQLNVRSYLEIGVRYGGTFIITVEYLQRFNQLKHAVGVDVCECPTLDKYKNMNSVAEFVQCSSRSKEFQDILENNGTFDLIFIDGDHSEQGCWDDFQLVKDKANICVFHDIVNEVCIGVSKVWQRLKKEYADDYVFCEYAQQYDSVKNNFGSSFLGLGMIVKKEYWQKIYSDQ